MDTKEASKEVAIAAAEASKLAKQVYAVKIRSEADLTTATETLSQIKKVAREIDKKRKSFTAPLTQVIKDLNEMFKDPLAQLSDAEALIKEAMLKYQQQVEARAAKKAQKIEDAVDSGEMGLADGMGKLSNIKQAPTGAQAESGSAQFRVVKKIRISDVSLLPPKYFLRPRVLDALRMEVEEDVKKNGAELPAGAEQYEDRQVAVRAA